MSSATGEEEIFCDTSVLLNYVLQQGDTGAMELLTEAEAHKVISEKVNDEFHTVPERREEIYHDFLVLVASDEDEPAEQIISQRDYLSSNDRGYLSSLREEITDAGSPKEKGLW